MGKVSTLQMEIPARSEFRKREQPHPLLSRIRKTCARGGLRLTPNLLT
jgi:hypothetical protein